MTTDTLEWKNLADAPNLVAVKAELKNQLAMWMAAQGDKGAQTEMEALEHQGRNRKKPAEPTTKKGKKGGRKKKVESE